MNMRWLSVVLVSILAITSLSIISAVDRDITLIGVGLVPGDSHDLSGLDGRDIRRRPFPTSGRSRLTGDVDSAGNSLEL